MTTDDAGPSNSLGGIRFILTTSRESFTVVTCFAGGDGEVGLGGDAAPPPSNVGEVGADMLICNLCVCLLSRFGYCVFSPSTFARIQFVLIFLFLFLVFRVRQKTGKMRKLTRLVRNTTEAE